MNTRKPVIHILTVLFICIWVLPVIGLGLTAVSAGWSWPDLLPNNTSFNQWTYVLQDHPKTLPSIGTTVITAVFVLLLNLLLALPAGNALGRYALPGKGLINTLLSIPILLPPLSTAIGLHKTFIRLNLTNSYLGVVLALVIPTLPYMIRALTIGFESLGFGYEEQAKTLGANTLHRVRYIALPHLIPAIAAGSSLTILIAMSQYVSVLLIGGGLIQTMPVVMFPFLQSGNISLGSIFSVLFAGMALLMLLLLDYGLRWYYRKDLLA